MEIVIGLIGAKRAGKTTAFEVINKAADVQEITLAAKLKQVSAEVFDVPRNYFEDQSLKEKDLDTPIFITKSDILTIFSKYGIKDLDELKYVRPHIGKVLHTPRQIAQYVGTEVLREYQEDIHCDHAARAVTKRIGVVTDMRFPNEYEYFSKNYPRFYPIYIQNYGAELAAAGDTHASEAHLKDLARKAVITIYNNGPIEVFKDDVRAALEEITQ